MAEDTKLRLMILTQEQQLLDKNVVSLTVDTELGQITVLPGHIPLFAKLSTGELMYRWMDGTTQKQDIFAVSGGFLDVNPEGTITVLADYAVRADEISIAQAEEAKRQAEEAMKNKESVKEFKIAEASLRQALNDLRVAQRRQKASSSPRL
ncbi:ATP synthase F1 subunit epsilon [Candidatus Woesebacteria bacterium]|nr:ATP synthase F1 subunit epsilon [Candidatus Woesebacteria bacterium]MCD8506795.1 ATP synthase F1 subunit epsilon [Candidatus Woesebacteria bacterium]MCD8527704.1 ATP synthase F1 subunit epsilon [Candidatus Woesebacteria bacterium]MCD8546327.1 ATP synthase F1 subunit epsilon [Candidatus Woesebacteria bacterium]